MVMRVTVAWLYIKPVDVKNGPTGDPVDSDPNPDVKVWADGLILKGLSYPSQNFDRFHPSCLLKEYNRKQNSL